MAGKIGKKKKASNKARGRASSEEAEVENSEGVDAEGVGGEGVEGVEGVGEDEANNEADIVRPEISREERRALFDAYQETVDTLEQVNQALEVATAERRAAIGTIFEKCGTGPFNWNGKRLKIHKGKSGYQMRVETAEAEEI